MKDQSEIVLNQFKKEPIMYKEYLIHLIAVIFAVSVLASTDRGYVSHYKEKWMWSGTGEVFVPNFAMYGTNGDVNLSNVTQSNLNQFLDDMFDKNGFNGIHVLVFGQWFHIGNQKVSSSDKTPDFRTFDKLEMIITTVYQRGGCTHLWAWGDDSRNQTCLSTVGGIMGPEEKAVWDMVYNRLNDLKGWTMGYGYDLWEWASKDDLKKWHDYLHAKLNFHHLLGARSQKNQITQIYDGLDYSSYENHKPDYNTYVQMLTKYPQKPSFSEDRFRMRDEGRDKDYTAEETRRGLWTATMAGGVAGIWGNLLGSGPSYPNADELLTYSKFWKSRFLKEMIRDNALTNGVALRNGTTHYVFYKENTNVLEYKFDGKDKAVIVVDSKKPYNEISLGTQKPGTHTYNAPHGSDWAIAVGDFGTTPPHPAPLLAASTNSISKTMKQGGTNPTNAQVTIINNGTGTLAWQAVLNPLANWVSISPQSGTDNDKITVLFTAGSLEPGTYTTKIQVIDANAANSPITIDVSLKVEPISVIIPLYNARMSGTRDKRAQWWILDMNGKTIGPDRACNGVYLQLLHKNDKRQVTRCVEVR